MFHYHSNGCYVRKKLHKKLESYSFKPPLKNLVLLDQDKVRSIVTTSKMYFLEKGRESQKYNNFKFCDNLP